MLSSERIENKTHNEENIRNEKEKKFGYTKKWRNGNSINSALFNNIEVLKKKKKTVLLSHSREEKKISWKSNKKSSGAHTVLQMIENEARNEKRKKKQERHKTNERTKERNQRT